MGFKFRAIERVVSRNKNRLVFAQQTTPRQLLNKTKSLPLANDDTMLEVCTS